MRHRGFSLKGSGCAQELQTLGALGAGRPRENTGVPGRAGESLGSPGRGREGDEGAPEGSSTHRGAGRGRR